MAFTLKINGTPHKVVLWSQPNLLGLKIESLVGTLVQMSVR